MVSSFLFRRYFRILNNVSFWHLHLSEPTHIFKAFLEGEEENNETNQQTKYCRVLDPLCPSDKWSDWPLNASPDVARHYVLHDINSHHLLFILVETKACLSIDFSKIIS